MHALVGLRTIRFSWWGINKLLTPYHKGRTLLIYLFSSLIGLADIIGLGSMVPVLMLAIDHSFLVKSSKLRAIYHYYGFTSEPIFLKVLIVFILGFFIVKNLLAIWLFKFIRRTAISISTDISSRSFDFSFRENTYERVASDGLGFNDTVLFTPYYFVSGIYLPFINIISEGAVVFMLVLVFTVYKPVIFFLLVGLLGTAFFMVNRYTRKRITHLGEQGSEFRERALRGLNFGISGFADIKSHGVEGFFKAKFLRDFAGFVANGIKAINYQLIPARINEFVSLVGIVVLVIYAYFYSGDNLGQVRVLAALFAISVFRLIPAANRILQAMMHLKMNAYTIDKLLPIYDSAQNEEEITAFHSEIVLKDIHFSYQGNAKDEVFEGLNINIKPGQVIGIAGVSGAGKTTLTKLLLGFCKPVKGTILVDGKDVTQGFGFHKLYSYMGQEPFVVNGTVADNVALGLEPLRRDVDRIEECLRMAAFRLNGNHNLVDIEVGEGGSKLSEGQKQRLVLARELYRNAPVMILDEPTSALDYETEKDVMNTLAQLKEKGKTIVIIAHRERIFELCDLVYAIENKKLTLRNK